MRRWTTAFFSFLLACTSLMASVTLTVTVKDELDNNVDGAIVYALVFTPTGPDPVNSQIGETVNGEVTLSLTDGLHYEIFPTKDGYTPTLRQRFSSPDPALHHHVQASGTPSPLTLTLRSGGTVEGKVLANVTNATADSMLFGQVFKGSNRDDMAMGACRTDGTGACLMTFVNVPAASANTYRVGAHDPTLNKGNETKVSHALTKGNQVGPYALDLSGGLPPETSDRQGGNQPTGDPSLQGVVMSTTNVPIPYVGVSYQSTMGNNFWTQTDQNGRFTLYGLTEGTTYYVQVFSGCNQQGCYEGYTSPKAATRGTELGPKDILFDSNSAPMKVTIQLPRAQPGNGEIPVYVKNQEGGVLPGANINIWPDGRNWHMNPGEACGDQNAEKRSNPGLANVSVDAPTGYGLITGLPPGNYSINVWSPFSSNNAIYNAGEDGIFNWDWNANCGSGTHADDLRVTISTVAPYMTVYDSSGNDLGLSSVTVVVNTVQPNADKTVHLNLTFPETVDLSADPVLVSLKYCGENGCSSGYRQFNGSGSTFEYDLAMATGSYWVDIYSKYWGVVREGGGSGQVVITPESGTIPLNLRFGRAGRVRGYLYKPDGTLYIPSNGEYAGINASGINVEGHGWANIAKDGSFTIGGLIPGNYKLQVSGGGNFDLASPLEPVKVTVVANQDTYAEYRTVTGTRARPTINFAQWTPSFSYERDGQDEPAPLQAYYVPAGTKMTAAKLNEILDDYDGPTSMPYAAAGDGSLCHTGQWAGGFCLNNAESPKAYDFYLFRKSEFRPGGSTYSQLSLLSSVKNVVVDDASATESLYVGMSTVTYVPVDMTPEAGSHQGTARLSGDVAAENIIREADFQALGGDFNNFISFIPMLTLYNVDGEFQSLGMVTPRPEDFTGQQEIALTRSLAEGDWAEFKTVFDGFTFSYRMEGLEPNTDYIGVFTTPNYPPYKVTMHTGANGTTTDIDIDMDDAVGAGATLTGIVKDNGNTPIANAAITIKSPGIETKNLTTGADGRYTLEALPKGAYRVTAVAAGYVPDVQAVTIGDEPTVTQDFSLATGAGIIRGTVYKRQFPSPQVLVGATVVAYNDTKNGENPTDPLYLYTVKTSSVGAYELSGLEVGDTYRISLAVPGKYVLTETTAAASSPVEGIDFTLQSKALDVEVSVRKRTSDFEIIINNPSDFASGEVRVGADPFVLGTSTDITSSFTELPNKQLVSHLPFAGLTAGADYLLHIEAESYAGETLEKEIPFSLAENGVAEKQVDLALLGDETENSQGRAANEVLIDESGSDPSGVTFPTGGLITATGTADVPSMTFAKTDRDEADALTDDLPTGGALSSDIYTLGLENAGLSEKGFNLTLGFDPDADWTELAAYMFNPTTQEWEPVEGVQTIDPTAGTIQINVTELNAGGQGSALRPRGARAAAANGGMKASFDGRTHWIRANATSGSGQFAVMSVPAATVTGTSYTGTAFKVFNFPNPFNLSAKAVPITHGGGTPTLNTTGTVIKFEVPSSVGTGRVVIRIYSLSGELVRELDEGDKAGGYYYYTAWDGKNKDGKDVAAGVYYGVISMPGVDVKDARFKLAVVK
jgi:hypothetical protein